MLKWLLVALVIGITQISCSSTPKWVLDKKTKIDNIQAVFINHPNDYMILTKEKNQLIATQYATYNGEVKLFMDVDAKERMWAEVRKYKNEGGGGGHTKRMFIFIFTPKMIFKVGNGWKGVVNQQLPVV